MGSADYDKRPEKRPRINHEAQSNNGKKKEHDDKGSSHGRALCPSSSTRLASPPWRPDDKDGHYVFELGENLTPRYKIIGKMGEETGRYLWFWLMTAKILSTDSDGLPSARVYGIIASQIVFRFGASNDLECPDTASAVFVFASGMSFYFIYHFLKDLEIISN